MGKGYNYFIKPSKHNKSFNAPNLYLCAKHVVSNILPVVGIDENSDESASEWCFILPEDADSYIKQKVYERQHKKEEIMQRLFEEFTAHQVPVEDTVYLFNPFFERFLIGENRYKSQASLSAEDAYKVIVRKFFNQERQWDGKTFYITDSVEAGNYTGAFRNVFIQTDGIVWVDQAEKTRDRDNLWEIIPSKELKGAFCIRPSNQNNVFTCDNLPDRWLGSTDFHARDYPVISLVEGQSDSTATNWFFLTKSERSKVLDAFRRQLLQELIFEVSDAFPQYDTSAVQQLCDSKNISSIQRETAIGEMRKLLLSGGVSNIKEINLTPLLLNPDFAWPGGRGWHTAYDVQLGSIEWCGGDAINACAEAWQSEYTFFQELRGVPKGLYRVDMQAFSRTRGDDMAWVERDSSFITPVIFANDMEMPVQNIMHTTFPNNVDYEFLQGSYLGNNASMLMMDGSFIPHNLKAASLAFAKGYYDQSVYCIANDGVIVAGIKDEHKRAQAWTAWDNLRISYLQETKENYLIAINCHLVKAKETEQLAKLKRIDVQSLSKVILESENLIENDDNDLGHLRNYFLLLNQEMKRARQLLALQEFGETEKIYYSYSQLSEEEMDDEKKLKKAKQSLENDSISHIRDVANSYLHIGLMIDKQNGDLALKHFQTSYDYYISVPYNYQSNLDVCFDGMSSIYLKRQQYDMAIDVWMKAIDYWKKSTSYSSNEKLTQVYCQLGHVYNYSIKNYLLAEESYKKGLAHAEKEYDEAVKDNYEYNIKSSKKLLSECLNNLAYALAYQKKHSEALNTIERAIALMPEEPNYYDSKGEILYMSGDKDGARTMWDKVISLDPDFAKKNESLLYKYLHEK